MDIGTILWAYYSQVRIITTKIIALLLLLDDTYDAYATIDEIRLLTHAINRYRLSITTLLKQGYNDGFILLKLVDLCSNDRIILSLPVFKWEVSKIEQLP